MAIAGIDVGTSGCKCTLYDDGGAPIGEAYEEYAARITSGEHLLDPLEVWRSAVCVMQRAMSGRDDVRALSVTSFGEAAVLLDERGRPLQPALLYTDPRGGEQCGALVKKFGSSYFNRRTGLNPGKMYSLPKLMWIGKNRPDVMKKCRRIHLFSDYLVECLSGISQIDYSLAARTMAFDINTLDWDRELLAFAGLDPELFPKPVPTGTPAGPIRKELAERIGINRDTLVVTGCHDQIAAAIGTGVYRPGMAVDGTGTVECITPVFGKEVDKTPLYSGNYAVIPFLNGQYVTYAFSMTGGALLKWYRDKIAYREAELAHTRGESAYAFFDREIGKRKPSGLLVLPYFAGAGTPYMDPSVRGAILGLGGETTSLDLYQALMEGVTYEMRLNLEKLEEAGIEIREIRATGGGALSELWLQMKADILDCPITTLGAAQSGTLGCVMLAGTACGAYSSLEEAERTFVRRGKTYEPDRANHERYQKLYRNYKKIYPAVKSVMEESK